MSDDHRPTTLRAVEDAASENADSTDDAVGGAGADSEQDGFGASASSIEHLIGSIGDDTLTADFGLEYLEGGKGADTLIGSFADNTFVVALQR